MEQKSLNQSYKSPTPGKFPIVAYDAIPGELGCIIGGSIEDFINNPYVNQEIFEKGCAEVLQSLNEAGFNTIISNFGNTARFWLCRDALNFDCSVIIRDDHFGKSLDHVNDLLKYLDEYIVNELHRKTALSGWLIYDEPPYNAWGDVFYKVYKKDEDTGELILVRPDSWNMLTYAFRYAQDLDPSRLCFTNLAAPENIPSTVTGTCTSYKEYLDYLQELFKPMLWCYDVYPIVLKAEVIERLNKTCKDFSSFEIGLGNTLRELTGVDGYLEANPYQDSSDLEVRYELFYKYLEIFRQNSLTTTSPFWAFCMCGGHGRMCEKDPSEVDWYMPSPRIGALRFEAFSALAYGAQGIVYWQYSKPRPNKKVGNYMFHTECPVDAQLLGLNNKWIVPTPGNFGDTIVKNYKLIKSPIYNAVQKVNSEIQKYSDVFLGCQCDAAYHVGETYADQQLYPGSLEYMGAITATGNGFLVTSIHNGEDNYIVIVSHDPFYEQRIRIILRKGYSYSILTDETVSDIYTPDNGLNTGDPIISRTLDAGGYMIIKWKKGAPWATLDPSLPLFP